MTRFFVSSVTGALRVERKKIADAIVALGHEPMLMENSPARACRPEKACLEGVAESDVLVLIVGPTYGSRTETEPDVSITRQEYREAKAANMDVLAHVLPTSSSDTDAAEIDAFRAEVKPSWLYSSVPQIADLSVEVMRTISVYLEKEGSRTRFSLFQRFDERFRPDLAADALIPFDLPLIGRAEELDQVTTFILDDARPSMLLIDAPGGIGKSKLLFEAAKAVGYGPTTQICVRFVSPDRVLTTGDLKELPPRRNLVIVIDDAHKQDQLEAIVRDVRSVNARARFVVSARPGAEALVEGATACVGRSVERLRLRRLDHADAVRLAASVLGAAPDAQLAERLTRVAGNNPLLIVVGARLVRDRSIAPDLLETADPFRRVVFGKLLDSRSRGQADWDRLGCREILEVVAAVGPVGINDERFLDVAANFVRRSADEVARGLAVLTAVGLLRLRGRLLGVSPDMLGDHLLHQAAIGVGGAPTGFVKRLIKAFKDLSPRNLLRNVAELQWRVGSTGEDLQLIEPILLEFEAETARLSNVERGAQIEALGAAAVYVPRPTLRLVQHELRLAESHGATSDSSFQQVRTAALGVLGILVRHPDTASEAAEALVLEAEPDDRPTNPHPEHPRRLLGEALEPRLHSFFAVSKAVLAVLRRHVSKKGTTKAWVPGVVAEALKREGHWSEHSGRTVKLGSFDLRPFAEDIRPIRAMAIELVGHLAQSDDLETAAAAVREVTSLLNPPRGGFNRKISNEERLFWQPEAEAAAVLLSRIGVTTPHAVITFLVRITPRRMHRDWWPEINGAVDRIPGGVPQPEHEDLFLALLSPWFFISADPDKEAILRKEKEDTARRLLARTSNDGALIDLVSATLKALDIAIRAYQGSRQSTDLFEFSRALAVVEPGRVGGLIQGILDRNEPRLSRGLVGLLANIALQKRGEELLSSLERVANSRTDAYRWDTTTQFGWLFGENPDAATVIRAVDLFVSDSDPWCRAHAADALRRIRGPATRDAVRLLLATDCFRTEAVDELFAVISDKYGIPFAELTNPEIESLVVKIQECRTLDYHHVREFLQAAFRRVPESVVSALLARIGAARDDDDPRSEPIPWSPFEPQQLSLRHDDLAVRGRIIVRVRDTILPRSFHRDMYVPALLSACVESIDEALPALREWMASGDPEKTVGAAVLAAHLLRGKIFTRHEVAAEILEAAARVSNECVEEAQSKLYSAGVYQVYCSSGGATSDAAVGQMAEGERLKQHYATSAPHAARLFEMIRSSGRSQADWERQHDEDLLAEDEGF